MPEPLLLRIPLLVVLLLSAATARADSSAITVRGLTVDFSPFTLVANAGEVLSIGSAEAYTATLAGKPVGKRSPGNLQVTAPTAPGLYPLLVSAPNGGKFILNLFVTVPASAIEDGILNGYRMGPPPPGHDKYPELYRAPTGFIEVTEELLDTQLSPHFKLRQFLCKQHSTYPKYVALQESLLVLLEGLLGAVRARGYAADTFGVISGYRTPWYNRKIGNVANSRHVYGDAMDLYVDVDGDGRMDDMNGDGLHDQRDVDLLAAIAEEFMAQPGNSALYGGIGRYDKTGRHGGFVHVDTRGYGARW